MEIVKINKCFLPLYTSSKRYFIITGGRGGSKTFTVRDFVLRLLEEVGQGILYTRYTLTSAQDTIIPLFNKYIEQVSNPNLYYITRNKIIHRRTKSFVLFSGIKPSSGDQTGKLKTLPDITTWVIEEGEDFNDEAAFTDIDDSIRAEGIPNRIIWVQNPTTREHFIYKKFFEHHHRIEYVQDAGYYVDQYGEKRMFKFQRCTHPEVEHIHTTYHINIAHLNKDKVAQWEKVRIDNPKKYEHKYIGAWLDRSEGVIFENWEEGAFDTSLPYAFGQDYGFSIDPTTLIKVAIDEKAKKMYWHEEYYKTQQLSADEILKINQARTNRNDLIIGDSQEGILIKGLKDKGLNIKPCKKGAGSVAAGITKMCDYIHIITPTSTNIKKEFNNYIWSDKKANIPIDDYNHAIDAGRYAFDFLTKKKRKRAQYT